MTRIYHAIRRLFIPPQRFFLSLRDFSWYSSVILLRRRRNGVLFDVGRNHVGKGMNMPAVARSCGLSGAMVRWMTARKQKNVTLEAAFKLFQSLGVSLQRPCFTGLDRQKRRYYPTASRKPDCREPHFERRFSRRIAGNPPSELILLSFIRLAPQNF